MEGKILLNDLSNDTLTIVKDSTVCYLQVRTRPFSLPQESSTSRSHVFIPHNTYNPQAFSKENLIGSVTYTVVFLMIFAFVRLRGKGMITSLLHVFINSKKTEIILNDGITQNLACYILSLVLSFSAISISAIYIFTNTFNPLHSLYIFTLLMLYHFAMLTFIRFLGWVFNNRSLSNEAIVNLWTYNILAGLFVAPFIIATFFVKSFSILLIVKIITLCFVLFLFVKIVRWFKILFTYRVSILYIILYLCTLEVMPLLVLYKLLVP